MKISVCMAVYNGEKFIEAQLNSILGQLKPEDEIIVSDDGSTDNTLKIVRSISDERIVILNNNAGNIVQNFENALNNATGEIFFLCDQDDVWHIDKVKVLSNHLNNFDIVFSNAMVFSKSMDDGHLLYDENAKLNGFIKNFLKNNYVGATMAFNKKILNAALPFPKGIHMHDAWIALIGEIIGDAHYENKPLIFYRRHGDNASQTGQKSPNSLLKKIRMRANLGYNLVKRLL